MSEVARLLRLPLLAFGYVLLEFKQRSFMQVWSEPTDARTRAQNPFENSGWSPGIEFVEDGVVRVGLDMMTGHPGIFAGGDMVPGERSVTVSVGHGKRAARNINAWLRGGQYQHPARHPLVTFNMLHLPVYTDAERTPQKGLAPVDRVGSFEEVVGNFTEREARYEAQRCLSCGNCYECDNCYAACPEDAIIKLGASRRYRYDYSKCTGCAACFEECPCHAIEMAPEPVGSH